MTKTIIKVDNLGKKYIISHKAPEQYTALRDVITNKAKAIASKFLTTATKDKPVSTRENFWALKNISFEVSKGEVLGIIGRNGAGKTTLLKILSRITKPTTGRIHIKDQVSSLLEVGTGFHPELTGRENIFLNGAILGMSKAEIKSKFDEIVAFAETEKFLDTPVKKYSSGMYVRLAFAVAAHLEPEILIIDEVLAVGDAEFQKKCLGKMGDIASKGRTILFVSHNMGAIQKLCDRVIIITQGQISFVGKTHRGIQNYLQSKNSHIGVPLRKRNDRIGTGALKFHSYDLKTLNGDPINTVSSGLGFRITLNYKVVSAVEDIQIALNIRSPEGQPLFCINTHYSLPNRLNFSKNGSLSCDICKLPLPPGKYPVDVWAGMGYKAIDSIENAFTIDVISGDYYGTGRLPNIKHGILIDHRWIL